ncbi:hypothetical protein OGAPHI_006976 [Ogataea philodendri]|uniref:UBX domain-containing protein n=1 Tax=Ogataea philodendri TaxID=1378263 RepID=A0A9P8NVC6_9ASCO|nr:uncharacterized protein OGAPHI_006976 [Ogataea philodendri]KAH3660390.1 hypothetical protein OGAPHI_006976 [Ogataea philodendri]
MSSLTINYNFRSFKSKAVPSKILNDVLIESCEYFKLESSRFVLKHKNQVLDLSLPLRLSNLPQGCKLDLVESTSKVQSGSGGKVVIKLQISAPEGDSSFVQPSPSKSVKEFGTENTIVQVLQEFEKSLETPLIKREALGEWKYVYQPVVQSMNKTLSTETDLNQTLKDLGLLNGNHALRLRFKVERHKIDTPTQTPVAIPKKVEPTVADIKPKAVSPVSADKPKDIPESADPIQVFVPSNEQPTDQPEDESVYEMSVDQARFYQSMLAKQAHPSTQMMTRKQREQLVPEKKPITECILRIKFPDYTQVQLVLQPDQTLGDLYNLLVSQVVVLAKDQHDQPQPVFELHSAYPTQPLLKTAQDLDKQLVADCQLPHRSLLVYRDNYKRAQYIKNEYLNSAKTLDELEEVKVSKQESTVEIKQESTASAKPQRTVSSTNEPRKVPKWLKLGKK